MIQPADSGRAARGVGRTDEAGGLSVGISIGFHGWTCPSGGRR